MQQQSVLPSVHQMNMQMPHISAKNVQVQCHIALFVLHIMYALIVKLTIILKMIKLDVFKIVLQKILQDMEMHL